MADIAGKANLKSTATKDWKTRWSLQNRLTQLWT
jgi:hypothetical protein